MRLPSSALARMPAALLLVMAVAVDAGTLSAAPPDVSSEHAARMRAGLKLFRDRVRQVLTQNCIECHGSEDPEGGLDLTTRDSLIAGGEKGPAVVSGKPEKSLIWKLVAHESKPRMPFERPQLPAESLKAIHDWITNEAPYDAPLRGDAVPVEKPVSEDDRAFWSLRPLKRPLLPAIGETAPAADPVDRFIQARLDEIGLSIVPSAPRTRLIRRLKLDLCGLPPAPDEIDAFRRDESPDAWARLVDRFLASPQYGERQARHWLDIVRFAESYGFEHDLDNDNAWHYRDFVIRAMNDNMPFDQFVQWQIAGDELAPDESLAWMATGFLAAGVRNADFAKIRVEQERYDELDDIASAIGTSMLGLSIGCARCHAHKFDPISQHDYYRFIATFERTIRGEIDLAIEPGRPPVKVLVASEGITPLPRIYSPPPAFFETTWFLRRGEVSMKAFEVAPAALRILTRDESKQPHRSEKAGTSTFRRRRFSTWLTDPQNGAGALVARVFVNRLWQHHFGRGIVETPNDFGQRGARPTHPALLEWLANELVDSGWDVKHLHRLILNSATWCQAAATDDPSAHDGPLFRGRAVQRLEAEVIRDAMLASSGQMNSQMFGPGTLDEGHIRRSIYFRVKRSRLIPMMTLFDVPDPLQSIGRRAETTVAPQLLALMNDKHVRQLASAFARSLVRGRALSDASSVIVESAYRRALGREPTAIELQQSLAFLQHQQAEYSQPAERVNSPPAARSVIVQLDATRLQASSKQSKIKRWSSVRPSTAAGKTTDREINFTGIAPGLPRLVSEATTLGQPAVRFGPEPTVLQAIDDQLNFGTCDFSVSVVFRLDPSAGDDNHILGKDSYSGTETYSGYFLQYVHGRLKFCTRRVTPGGGQAAELLTEQVIQKGPWYRVTGTRRSGEISLFVDGATSAELSRREPEPIDVNNKAGFKIGEMDEVAGSPFNGSIAELLVFNRALTTEEVRSCHEYLRQKYIAVDDASPLELALTDFCQALFCLNEFIYIE